MNQILKRIEREMKQRQRTPAQIMTRRISLAVLVIAIPLLATELVLRLTGFQRPQANVSAQQKMLQTATDSLNKRLETNAFQYDPHLFWNLSPGKNLYGLSVDANGLLTWPRPTESGPRRTQPLTVLCLGDSVTALTYRTYPEIAEQLAAAAPGTRPIQFVNGAVPGYTTEQALRRIDLLKSVQPDVVILCFGWNDHFPALRLPDHELGVSSAGEAWLHNKLKDVRLYQLLGAPLGAQTITQPSTAADAATTTNYRVNPAQFQANLEALIAAIKEAKAIPVLATEPENLKATAEAYLENNAFIAPTGRDNHEIHARYNDMIRATAAAQKTPLLDLEEEFLRRPRDYMLEPDGIHLTSRGHNHVARLVLAMLRNEGLITPGEYDSIAQAEKHDTTAPDKPRITWSLAPDAISTWPQQPFSFSIIPQNSGNTRWLRKHIVPQFGTRQNVSYGSSYIYSRWRTVDAPTTDILQKLPLPADILPGEATSVTMTLQAPAKPGNYEVEIGLLADQIGPLSQYGAETTTLTVTTLPPDQAPQ